MLNIARCSPATGFPSVSLVQSGRVMRVSRGMETTEAVLWPLLMCSTIAVSERAVPSSAPYAEFAPDRESEPSTKMSSEPLSMLSGRSLPSAALMSTALRLPLSLK